MIDYTTHEFRIQFSYFTLLIHFFFSNAQQKKTFTHADTLRGSITPERAWWDVLRYDITVKPDYIDKTTEGNNVVTYKVLNDLSNVMQIDLQDTLRIDSIILDHKKLSFTKEGDVWHVKMPVQKKYSIHRIAIFFSGKARVAPRAPWDGSGVSQKIH